MSITTDTITKQRHRATLAGGITASMEPACYGATLVLDDTLRRLALTLTPEQVAELATWETWKHEGRHSYAPSPVTHTARTWEDVYEFAYTTRYRLDWNTSASVRESPADIVTLRTLAVAVLAQEAQA